VSGQRLVDLSIPLFPGAVTFPGDPPVRIDGPYNALNGPIREYCYTLRLPTQAGTHIQGPHYFRAEGRTIDAFPLTRFAGEAWVIDVRGQRLVTPAALAPLANAHLAGQVVLLHSGYMARLLAAPTPEALERLVAAKPGLTLEAAHWLVERGLRFIGIDSVGLEPGGATDYSVNRYLCQEEVLILEGLINLEQLPGRGAWVEAFPLPIRGVEGTPCRAIAWLPG